MINRIRPARLAAALAATALLTLTACGGSDDADGDATGDAVATTSDVTSVDETATDGDDAASTDTVDAGEAVTQEAEDAIDDMTETIGADEAIAGVGFETRLFALASVLGGEYELVDDTTARMTFTDDSMDPVTGCIVAGSILEPGEQLVLVLADGDHACE